tara:strand:- start:1613 stop:1930 length:318 start_codon:yes stop_codon:yes gene_type:complete
MEMNFKIDITKVNVTENGQDDLTYYIATLFCEGIKLSTLCYHSFNIYSIDSVSDAVKLISLLNTDDAKDKGQILKIALNNNAVEYTYTVDQANEYINDYGDLTKK